MQGLSLKTELSIYFHQCIHIIYSECLVCIAMSKQRNYPDSSWAVIPATETRASHHYLPSGAGHPGRLPSKAPCLPGGWNKGKPACAVAWRPIHHVSHFSAPSLPHVYSPPGSPPSQNSFFSQRWEDGVCTTVLPPAPHWQLTILKKILIPGWAFVAAYGLSLVVASEGYSSLRSAGFSLWWFLLVADHRLQQLWCMHLVLSSI